MKFKKWLKIKGELVGSRWEGQKEEGKDEEMQAARKRERRNSVVRVIRWKRCACCTCLQVPPCTIQMSLVTRTAGYGRSFFGEGNEGGKAENERGQIMVVWLLAGQKKSGEREEAMGAFREGHVWEGK